MIVRLADFDRVLFFTGAGLSSESGIPTYRGQGGIWKEYDYRDYACQTAFDRDPDRVWDFHDKRRAAVAKCDPNRAHEIIAKSGHPVVTQNIDGLHTRAASHGGGELGAAGVKEVVELHGCLWRVRCDPCNVVQPDFSVPMSPRKHSCGAYFRPDIVWFEDSLDHRNLRRARELLESCDLLVTIGTSGVVYPAADLPRIAVENGATSVEINLEDTPVSHLYQHKLRGPASEMLAAMI